MPIKRHSAILSGFFPAWRKACKESKGTLSLKDMNLFFWPCASPNFLLLEGNITLERPPSSSKLHNHQPMWNKAPTPSSITSALSDTIIATDWRGNRQPSCTFRPYKMNILSTNLLVSTMPSTQGENTQLVSPP